MAEAEARIRKTHKHGAGTDRLVNAARLGALEKNLGVAVKRHREPDQIKTMKSSEQPGQENEDEVILIGKES